MKYPEPCVATDDEGTRAFIMERLRERLTGTPREGVHVSDLLYCLLKQWAKKKLESLPRNVLEEDEDEQLLMWVVGRSHEDIFGKGMQVKDPIERDGIVGSIDRWSGIPVEIKSTRASAKKDIMEMPHYVAQVAAYCYGHNQTECTVIVFHVMGDYYHQTREGKAEKAGPSAKLKVYHLEFEKEMLAEWWDELLRRKAILEGDEKPEVDDMYSPMWEWECQYCKVGGYVNCEKWLSIEEDRRKAHERKGRREQSIESA